jgi:hypothetical protein
VSADLLERSFVLALFIGVSLPLFQFQQNREVIQGMKRFALFMFVIGSLLPIGRYHVSDWHKEKTLMANLRSVATYLTKTASNDPIITIPGNDHRLNYASDYRLGINWDSIEYVYPDARITSTSHFDEDTISYFIVFEDTGNSAHRDLIDFAWEELEIFGDSEQSRITLYFSNAESVNKNLSNVKAYASHP